MARKTTFAGYSFARRARPADGLTALCGSIAAVLLLLFGGPSHAAGPDQGLLEIRVKDHREAIGDFSRLTLKLGLAFWQVGWRELSPAVQTVDLTKYTFKESVTIFKAMIDAGAFDAIQLKLDGTEGILKKSQRQAQVKNVLTPIKLPFTVQRKGETVIILDLVVLDMSDHPPRGYELGIKGYELYANGKLIDKVPPG
jgi:hypothetical protein